MEIGSIYEIDPKLLAQEEKVTVSELRLGEVEKYRKKYVQYTASGREAIALALSSLAENRPDVCKRCLLPAYMCDSVFFPFERAGWEIYFYPIETTLEAEEEKLRQMIENIRPGLLFVHAYYGVDTWKPMRSLVREWKGQGICIMEDVTQSYYLPEAGLEADYVVGSLRKWYPVPDGGFAASDALLTTGLEAGSEFTQRRIELLTEKWNYLYGLGTAEEKARLKEDYLLKNKGTEEWLDAFDGISALSAEAARILKNTNEKKCRNIRNANCSYLLERISGRASFHPVFPVKEQNNDAMNAPLYFPVYAEHRDELQKFLSMQDIYAPVLWPVGRENQSSISEAEAYIYGHMLALPIDQRYKAEEMERIACALIKYDNEYYK